MRRNQPNIFSIIGSTLSNLNTRSGNTISEIFKQEARSGNTAVGYGLNNIDVACSGLENPWNDIVSNFYKASFYFHKMKDYALASRHMSMSLDSFLTGIYRDCDEAWVLPIVKCLCLFVRTYAQKSHFSKSPNSGGNDEELSSAANLLYKVNRMSAGQEAKMPIILHLANQIFKIYFRMRNLNATKQLVRTIESSITTGNRTGFNFERYTQSERVTWKYFTGVVSMFDNRFTKAEEELSYAFLHCHEHSVQNKKTILERLIVVRLVIGKVPTSDLLQKYGLLQRYGKLVFAYKQGDLHTFDSTINEHYKAFFAQGTYLILHHARIVVYRNFFKKAVRYYVQICGKKATSRIRFDVLSRVIGKMFPMLRQNIEETECVLSTLIYKGYLMGYLSHQKKMLVIKDYQSAFPPIKKQHEKR